GNLNSFNQKPDCYKEVAARLKLQCEDDIPENDRIQAAIRFTLCELSTARAHSHPLECASFVISEVEPSFEEESTSSCVEALSRSTQHWSSYSGYLREIPQLCFAYRRWYDIDRAKGIYQNATMEKLSLLKLLNER
ncbi:hypothetical protein CALVIDRAFT_460759, partial [Calocera viscosa TUFC12733]